MKDIRITIASEICQILQKNNIKYFIDFGTLLAFHKEKKIIDNHGHFDIMAFFEEEFDILNAFEKLINKYHFKKITRILNNDIIFIHQDFIFKIYKCKIKNQRYFPITLPKYEMPLFFIDELEKLYITKDIYFYCPRHKETYLKHRYGNNYFGICSSTPDISKWCHINHNIIEIKNIYTAYTYGVYDMFHIGHLNLFKRIKQNFDKLVVGIHNDEQVKTYKQKPIIPYKNRLEIIKSCRYVDEIIENAPLIVTNKILNTYQFDYVVAGAENKDYINKYYQVDTSRLHLIKRTKNVSSRKIRKIIIHNS